jgi:hypothetical protein
MPKYSPDTPMKSVEKGVAKRVSFPWDDSKNTEIKKIGSPGFHELPHLLLKPTCPSPFRALT